MKKIIPFLLLLTMISLLVGVVYLVIIAPSWWMPIIILIEVAIMALLSAICIRVSTQFQFKTLHWKMPIEITLFWIVFYFCMLPATDTTKPIYDILITIGAISVAGWSVYGYRKLREYNSSFPISLGYCIPKIW